MSQKVSRLAPACSEERISADLEALAAFRDPNLPGWTRTAFSQEGIDGRNWVKRQMLLAGMAVSRDAANNLIGTLQGVGGREKAIAIGSHTDTVNSGGRFDGIIGVLGAIEIVRSLRAAGMTLNHDLRVVDFFNEEPNAYGLSCVGSRAIAGVLTREHLELCDSSGQTLAEGLESVGGVPADALKCSWGEDELLAFLELHIEQGPVLERSKLPLAVVTSIAGIHRVLVEFVGQADHAGATPMTDRRDALCAASEGILEVERLASGGAGVGTVGRIESEPGATNVVPATARFWVEFRSGSEEWLESRQIALEVELKRIAHLRSVEVSLHWLSVVSPVAVSAPVQKAIESAIDQHGLQYARMFSGAGHDAAHLARLAPMGMIFVPSKDGRSHTPEEWTDVGEIAIGARMLLQTIINLDMEN